MSIRLKLTIIFLAIALIPLLFVSALTFNNYRNSLERLRLSELDNIATFTAGRIETYFAGLKNDIEIVQATYAVKKNLPILTRFVRNPANPECLAARKMLHEAFQKMPAILGLSDIMLLNPEGKIVYVTNADHYERDFLNSLPDPRQKAFTEGKDKVYFSDTFLNRGTGNRPGMLVTAPAFALNGAFAGVIALEVDAEPIYKLIQNVTGLGETGETLVGKRIGNEVLFLSALRHDREAALKKRTKIGEEIAIGIQNAVLGKIGTGQFIDYRGKKVIGAWRYIPSLDWGIVTKIDEAEAFADVKNLTKMIFLILCIISFLSGLTAFSLAQSIAVPIKRLSKGAEIVGSGNLDYQIGSDLKDELGQLSRTFDKMTQDIKKITASRDDLNREIAERKRAEDELKKAKDGLELRVQERTTELQLANKELDEEIAVRGRTEGRLSRLSRLYAVLSKVNEAIVRIHEPKRLYEQVCRIAVEDGFFKMAWIGLTDPATKRVKPITSFGDTGGYLEGIKIYAADVLEGRGPTGTAAFQGTYSISSSIEHDQRMLPWRDKALHHGFLSSAAFPLRRGSAVIGAFTIYSDRSQFFTDEEIKLMSSLAEDISFAIETMANDKKRLQAEEALRQANAYNRSLIEASLDPLVTINPDGRITDVNIATEHVTGLSRKELIGTDFSDYFTEPDKARAGYQKVFSEGLVKDYSLEIRHRDGHSTPVLYNASVYHNESGKAIGVFAAARDITERRESEGRTAVTSRLLKLYTLKFSLKEYMDAAVKLIRDWSGCYHAGIRIPDPDGNIPFEACAGYNSLFLNTEATLSLEKDHCLCTRVVAGKPALQELSSTTPNGSCYFNNTKEFMEGLTKEERTQYRGVCMQNGYKSLALIPIRHRDEIVAIHLADKREGTFSINKIEFIERLAVLIGEAMFRFGIEEELQNLNRELEQRVIERTVQLETSNKELEAFSYSVSHDLRAPLRSIDGFSLALLEDYADKLGDAGKEYLQRVRAAAIKMGQLIDTLLNLSRLTRGALKVATVDLSALARNVAEELRGSEPERRVEFVIADRMTAEGDPVMLQVVIQNLLANAWKFTRKRDAALIEFGLKHIDGRPAYFVRDNGTGFDMAYADKLFSAFQRLHTATEFPGLGIGLATVQRIINRHGGRVWAEAEVDKGATMYFTLS